LHSYAVLCYAMPLCSILFHSFEIHWGFLGLSGLARAFCDPAASRLQAAWKSACAPVQREYHGISGKFMKIHSNSTEIHGISEWIAINPGVQASFLRMRMTPRHLQPHPLLPKPKSSRLSDALTSRRGCQRFARDIQWSLEKIWGAFEQRSKVPLTCLVLGLHKLHLVVRLSLGFVSSAKGLT
jgi:hypothetical protein